jgi:hypothetical protein
MTSINHYRQKIERSCFCDLGASILSLSSILIFDFGIYYFLHFALNLTVELDNDLVLVCQYNFIRELQNNLEISMTNENQIILIDLIDWCLTSTLRSISSISCPKWLCDFSIKVWQIRTKLFSFLFCYLGEEFI